MTEKGLVKLETEIATITFTGGNDSSDEESSRTKSSEGDEPTSNVDGKLVHSSRFNPFDKEQNDAFDSVSQGRGDKNVHDNDAISVELTEDHFSLPEGVVSEKTIAELEEAIRKLKDEVIKCGDQPSKQQVLVNKLIQLRLQLAQAKDAPDPVDKDVKQVLGHQFWMKDTVRAKHFCEQCSTMIWGVLQEWHRCKGCGMCCHTKCLNSITRTCACVKVKENPQFILDICPEKGLSSQNYQCAECRASISYQRGFGEPRRCDYTGGYYCNRCHWNDTVVIPARVMHNWDFEPRNVCRASKQFLKLMQSKSVLRVADINPMLFSYVEELNQVNRLREEILVMKKYFISCNAALRSKLLLQLKSRQHFVENSDMYSLRDLIDVASDELLPQLIRIHSSFAQHIKTDCETCRTKGNDCLLCDYKEVLFPFDNHATVCANCSAVLHRHCYFRRNQHCPRCDTLSKDSALTSYDQTNSQNSNQVPSLPFKSTPITNAKTLSVHKESSQTGENKGQASFGSHTNERKNDANGNAGRVPKRSLNPFDEPTNPFDEPPNPFDEPSNPFDEPPNPLDEP